MSLQEFVQKCKSEEVFTLAIIILVGFGGFGLGRLSVLFEKQTPILIENPPADEMIGSSLSAAAVKGLPQKDSPKNAAGNGGGLIVASKGGTKYHFPWCGGARSISEANKVWFKSEEEARAAGYAPASNCKGLK
jgi:hypothetical protein